MNRVYSAIERASAGGQCGAHSSAVEPPAHNRSVPGSNPGGPTISALQYRFHLVTQSQNSSESNLWVDFS